MKDLIYGYKKFIKNNFDFSFRVIKVKNSFPEKKIRN